MARIDPRKVVGGLVDAAKQAVGKTQGGITAADKKTVKELGKTLRASADRLPDTAKGPTWDLDRGVFVSPKGNGMITVHIKAGFPVPGSSSGFSEMILVDPKSREYFLYVSRGLAGGADVQGPGKLPASVKFSKPEFTDAQLKRLSSLT